MPIRVTCPKCHTRFNVSEKFAGKEGPCPKCKAVIKVPDESEAVVIEAPKPKGPVDSTGKSILKPIRRKETKLSSVQITLIVSLIVTFLLLALLMRFMIEDASAFPMWLLIVSAAALSFPLVFVAYTFLRDQELEPFWGRELWTRVGICSAVYSITWIAMPIAAYAFNDHYEIGSYVTAGVIMFVVGTMAAMISFDFEAVMGAVHFGLYLGVGLLGRWLAGIGVLPTTPDKGMPSSTINEVSLIDGSPVLEWFATGWQWACWMPQGWFG